MLSTRGGGGPHARGVQGTRHTIFKGRSTSLPAPQCAHRQSEPVTSTATQALVDDLDKLSGRYRRGVGVCLVNEQGLVFAAQRCDDDAFTWQMPQGGIDEGEDPQETAVRELWEETSISSVEVLSSVNGWLKYDYPTYVKCSVRGHYVQYDGQVQRWFLLRFKGSDSEVNLDTAHKEFRAWQWMKLEDLPKSVIPFKKDVYEHVVREFLPKVRAMKRNAH